MYRDIICDARPGNSGFRNPPRRSGSAADPSPYSPLNVGLSRFAKAFMAPYRPSNSYIRIHGPVPYPGWHEHSLQRVLSKCRLLAAAMPPLPHRSHNLNYVSYEIFLTSLPLPPGGIGSQRGNISRPSLRHVFSVRQKYGKHSVVMLNTNRKVGCPPSAFIRQSGVI